MEHERILRKHHGDWDVLAVFLLGAILFHRADTKYNGYGQRAAAAEEVEELLFREAGGKTRRWHT